jgi:hypothetical protein
MKGTEIPLFCYRSLALARKPSKSSGASEVLQGFRSSPDTKPLIFVSGSPKLLPMDSPFSLPQKFLTKTGKRG